MVGKMEWDISCAGSETEYMRRARILYGGTVSHVMCRRERMMRSVCEGETGMGRDNDDLGGSGGGMDIQRKKDTPPTGGI
jgi:hypothetical protein